MISLFGMFMSGLIIGNVLLQLVLSFSLFSTPKDANFDKRLEMAKLRMEVSKIGLVITFLLFASYLLGLVILPLFI